MTKLTNRTSSAMSIVWSNSDGWIICHSAYLHDLYKNIDAEQVCLHCGRYNAFHIHSPFLKRNEKYQDEIFLSPGDMEKSSVNTVDVILVNTVFQKMMNELRQDETNYFSKQCPRIHSETGNITAISAADLILRNHCEENSQLFNGENINEYSICISFRENDYFIPPDCRFFCSPVKDFEEKFRRRSSQQFDVILLDPPWWNKHVRRKNATAAQAGYKMMYDEELSKVPIDSLLCSNGLVIVWCTNSQQHINYLINDIFPIWNVEYVCSWYWMKVTENGTPICKFTLETGKKKPFERIIFGARRHRCRELRNPDADKLIVSVPSAIHSHKPPLINVLSEYIPSNAKCLEMFARYLLPHWISTGNEVLKLQQKLLFVS